MTNHILPTEIKSLLSKHCLIYTEDKRTKPRKIIFVRDKKRRKYCLKFGLEKNTGNGFKPKLEKLVVYFH